jgi:phenylpyruvate tautomerase PptA (4-oxalocrotonate tautomerase family)
MDLFFPAGALAADARAQLADDLTTVLLRAERAPETQFFRDITWLHVHELPADAVMAAGRPIEQPTFRVEVSVPEGALSPRRKQELVAEATRVVRDAAGIAEADGLRVWVLIRDVPDGNWGAGGQVVEFAKLREIAREQAAASAGAPAG